MRARAAVALLALAFAAGCGSSSTPPSAVTVAPVDVMPSGAQEVTPDPGAPPVPGNVDCDREASLCPGPLPPPGAMPPGSTMAAIAERGRLIAGVDQSTYHFGFLNPLSGGQIEGFDIDMIRAVAKAIFGDPGKVHFKG